MYNMYMSEETLSISAAREQLAVVVDRVHTEHRPVFLSRHGRRVAAVVDAADFERLLELAEDMAGIRAAEAARAELRETGETPIPWEDVKVDLGL
jgi:prevent-host-death family protein